MFLEDELFDERAICEAIFKHSAEAILITDSHGKIIHVNPAVLHLFQYNFYELITQPIHILLPENLRSNHQEHIDNYAEKPQPRSMGSGRVLYGRKKDGSTFPLSASLSPAVLGETNLVVALVIDLTELEESRSNLNHLNQKLESKVEQRTKELAQSIAKLEEANKDLLVAQQETQKALQIEKDLNELKSRFVSMASHEFRTPLSTILSSLTLLEKYEQLPDAKDKKNKHFDRIRGNVKHLTSILNDFLSLDKLQSGALNVEIIDFDLNDFVAQLLTELEAQLKTGQNFNFTFSGEKIISSDPKLIKNILINLLSNASKYSPEDASIEIEIESKESLEIIITDHGIGIPEEDKKHMFERFFRAQNVTNIQGTGLGLTIVKRYVDLLKGSITFDSEYNKGTIFTVKI